MYRNKVWLRKVMAEAEKKKMAATTSAGSVSRKRSTPDEQPPKTARQPSARVIAPHQPLHMPLHPHQPLHMPLHPHGRYQYQYPTYAQSRSLSGPAAKHCPHCQALLPNLPSNEGCHPVMCVVCFLFVMISMDSYGNVVSHFG